MDTQNPSQSILGSIPSLTGSYAPAPMINPPQGAPNMSVAPAPNMSVAPSAQAPITPNAPKIQPTSTGGVQVVTAPKTGGLADYVSSNYQTPNGGSLSYTPSDTASMNGFSGTPANTFSIDTSNIPSSALGAPTSQNDITQTQSTYSDYVNALAQANGYSPDYVQALQAQYAAQQQGAALNLNSAQLNSNFYTGNNLGGDTLDYASGITAKAQAQNTLEQGVNAVNQLGATQALNTAQLQRTGNIAAAQAELQYSPTAMTGAQAITQYNTLGQQFPSANIPPFDPTQDPQAQLQLARQLVSQSPAYNAGFTSTYQTPGGGTSILNKLNLNGLQQNSDGSLTLVPAAAAALGAANANVVQNQVTNLSNINSAIQASGKTIQTMSSFMNQYGLNQSSIPIANQIANSANSQLNKAGALAALKVDLNTLRSDYSQFLLGRGGSVAGVNDESANAIPDNISPDQLQTVYSQMVQDGHNTADAVSVQVNSALQGIQTNTAPSASGSSGSSVGSSWATLLNPQ